MSNLRLVVAGRFMGGKEIVIVEPLFADTWESGVANAVDAPRVVTQAEAESCAGAYVMGEYDFTNGTYNPPHWNTPEYDAWARGYNDEWARSNGRTLLR